MLQGLFGEEQEGWTWALRQGLVLGGIVQWTVTLTSQKLLQRRPADPYELRFSVPIGLLEAIGVLFPWEGEELGP